MEQWYFAYGSNLSLGRKAERTGVVRAAVRCRLPGYRLSFSKRPQHGDGAFATIVPADGHEVWGVAYLCDETAVELLDHYEGVAGGHYVHRDVQVVCDDGRVLTALTYVAGAGHTCDERRPDPGYLALILEGAREHCLPDEYVRALEELGEGPPA